MFSVWWGMREERVRYSFYHPGEGRGPIGKVVVTERSPALATSPNWAPAFAGVE